MTSADKRLSRATVVVWSYTYVYIDEVYYTLEHSTVQTLKKAQKKSKGKDLNTEICNATGLSTCILAPKFLQISSFPRHALNALRAHIDGMVCVCVCVCADI